MEGTEVDSLAACLLQWVRSFEGKAETKCLGDLRDGISLWSILREVDTDYFSGELPEPDVHTASDWTRKWQNLKYLEKQLSVYYRDVCNGQEQMNAEMIPDLKAIAAEASEQDIEKLIMGIIRAAMASSESNQNMAQRLMSLGREKAMLIANELRNMEDAEFTESEPVSRDESAYQSEQEMLDEKPRMNGTKQAGGIYQDPLLEREEELLQAQATIDKLQATQAESQRQINELRQEKERLQEAFDSYRNEIDTKGRKAAGDDSNKKLQRQADNDRGYIEDLESQLQSSKSAVETYERQVQRWKDEADGTQELRDDLQMLKVDNDDLHQKVRANENLKKKIQSLQEHEKANATLRDEVKQANERLEELDRLKQLQAGLEKEIIEKKGLIRNQEYQINELTTTRRHVENDARLLSQKLQDARERHDRDHETIAELKGRLQDSSLDDAADAEEGALDSQKSTEPEPKVVASRSDESKHLAEKLALVEEQLETADVRLKQASERNTSLEERQRDAEAETDRRQEAEVQAEELQKTVEKLRGDLAIANKPRADASPPTSDMTALQRENHLMATAWYDLSSRLQNNGISLGRRRQEPKSWIGKQRALVGPGSAPQR